MSTRILIFAAVLFLLDLYVFQGVKLLIQHRSPSFQRIVFWVYWLISAFSIGTIFMGQFFDWHTWNKVYRTYSFALIFVFSFTKIIIGVFMLLDDILRLFRLIWAFISTKFFASNAVPVNEPFRITRLNFIIKAGFGIAAIPFFTLIKGMISGKYNYKVRPVNLALKNLPSAFDGLKIVQISDLHTGSFMGTEHLEEAARLIMEQKPDLIFFTGDLVNDVYTEALPFKQIFQSLKARHGVYSILGNHDYGDYYRFPDEHSKHQNLEQLKAFHGEVGWRLLLNEHAYIERDGQKIGLIGVENFSGKRNFSRYGSMEVATKNFEAQPVNILLSHDPSHWDYEIRDKYKYVDLTLSGHTHGFQFGIEIPGLKWSPVQYMYKQWADLYKEENQYLYVNRGLGFLGYPGRVGILPEITVFTLSQA